MKLPKKSKAKADPLSDKHNPGHPEFEPDTEPIDRYGKTRRRRILNSVAIHVIWWTTSIGLLGSVLFFTLIYNGYVGDMPDLEQLKNPINTYASIVYSSDGVEMGRFFPRDGGNRVFVDYSQISPNVVNALVATEDERFTEHSGIDFRALGRVLTKTFIMNDASSGGGSTITQQLAKLLYTDQSSSSLSDRVKQKPVEWMIALKLERYYSKEEIIQMYLNKFDFLHNAVGIQSAAEVYFDTIAADLSISQAALLVGMVKNPNIYNPVSKPEAALNRRNVVIDNMARAGYITAEEAKLAKAEPLGLRLHKVNHMEGIAPYFRAELRRILNAKKPVKTSYADVAQYYADSAQWANNPVYGWIEKNPKKDGTKYNLDTDGLRIYTTIDSRMQKYAEEAVTEHLTYLQKEFNAEKKGKAAAPYTSNTSELSNEMREKLILNAIKNSPRYAMHKAAGLPHDSIMEYFNRTYPMKVFSYEGMIDKEMTPRDSILYYKHFLRAGFMSMEPNTGYVKAYVGGPNYQYFTYDMVSTGRRQVGSTMKPYLYAYAMDEDYTPCDVILNSQPTFSVGNGRTWSPRNSGGGHVGEYVTLKWALTNSNNWISARLLNELRPATLVNYLHNFGITGEIPANLALALGTCDVSLREMVGGYSAFANNGFRTEPIFVTAIADHNGNIIQEFTTESSEVLSKQGHYRILDMLLNVVNQGTGSRLRRAPFNLTAETGGKTGTTNSNSDAWFMGFTPQLVSGVWVGGEERTIHFNSMKYGQGAAAALPIYGKFMTKVYADKNLPYSQAAKFEFPSNFDPCAGRIHTFDHSAEETVDTSLDNAFE